MDLSLLNSGTPSSKAFLKPVVDTLTANKIVVGTGGISTLKYSTWGDGTPVDFTTVETNISEAKARGDLLFPAGIELGAVIRTDLSLTVTSTNGETLNLVYYMNTTPMFTHSVPIPSNQSDMELKVSSKMVVRTGEIGSSSVLVVGSSLLHGSDPLDSGFDSVRDLAMFDQSIPHTLSVTAQWSGNTSILTPDSFTVYFDF